VLFISAMTDTTDKVKGFSVGGVDYVIKPFAFEEVLARVETHLALQRARHEIVRKNHELDVSYHRLKELEALREALTRMVVHDLRSPLMGITGYLELLEEEIGDGLSAEAWDLLEHARSASAELTTRISTILDVYRLEERAMPLNMALVDARSVVEGTIKGLGPQFRDSQIAIQAPDHPVMLSCDRDLVERVLANFLFNAQKFSPPNSPLEVSVEPGSDSVQIAVRDHGPGVPLEYRESIFNKFEQVGAWKQGQRRGTGLGLAFCKLAVEAHSGTIGVDCPDDGGSLFWFRLPLGGD
jgi:K+-sensing histidine kinase KdpD